MDGRGGSNKTTLVEQDLDSEDSETGKGQWVLLSRAAPSSTLMTSLRRTPGSGLDGLMITGVLQPLHPGGPCTLDRRRGHRSAERAPSALTCGSGRPGAPHGRGFGPDSYRTRCARYITLQKRHLPGLLQLR